MEYIVGWGTERDPNSISLSTRRGTHIPNDAKRPESHPAKLRRSIEEIKNEIPNAELRSITSVYNCVGLVFAARRTWVESTELPMIIKEDGYRLILDERFVQSGDIVTYRKENDPEIKHIGIVIENKRIVERASFEIRVLSKWGEVGEYIHPLKDVPPIYGATIEFWSEKRALYAD